MCGFIDSILVPFGVLSSQTNVIGDRREFVEFQSPLGFLFFQTLSESYSEYSIERVPIPFGVSVLPNDVVSYLACCAIGSNPLWGFCSSKHFTWRHHKQWNCSNPLWGFCSSKQKLIHVSSCEKVVPIPFGVSVLPNSISAIPVFMRAKLVVCGEESFFSNFSTEFSLKMSLSPVFMRCAVKFIFSFIAFIYYNGNFL